MPGTDSVSPRSMASVVSGQDTTRFVADSRSNEKGVLPPVRSSFVRDTGLVRPEDDDTLEVKEARASQAQVGQLHDAFARSQIVPLRHENQRLLRANNGLHVTLINEQEKQDSLDRGWQNKTRDLQNAVNDLKFLNAQKTRQVHSQEVHIAQLKTRLNNILEGKLTFNKETFESTYRATEAPLTEQKSVDRARVDLYHVSEANRQLLQGEVARFAEVERGYQEELEALQGTIGRRDEEIARLSGALSSERSWDKLTQEYNLDIKEKEIVNLHARIDFLNQEKERVQGDVRAYEEHGATQANLDLLKSKNSEIEDLTERWSIAQSTVARLETELKRLASAEALKLSNEQEVAKQVSIRVRAKDQEINALKGEYDALLLNVEQKNAECLRVTQQLRDLQISNDAYTSQRASDAAQAKIDSLNLQVSSSTNRLDSALQSEEKSRTRVMDLEQAARKQSKQFRLEMDSLRNELQQALDLNKSIIHKYKSLSATRVGADAERARLEDDLALTGQSADGIAQERDYFKGETSRLNAALVQLKQSQVEAEANLLKLHTHARGVGVEAESLREERASLNEEVNKYSLQVKQLHDKFIGSEAEVTRLSAMLNDVGQVADKASDAMEEANVTGVAFRKLQRRYEELEHKLGMVTKERMALGQRLETATQERNQLAVVVKDFDIKFRNMATSIEALTEDRDASQTQYSSIINTLNAREEQEQSRAEDAQAYTQKVSSLSQKNNSLAYEIDALNLDKQHMDQDITALRAQVENLLEERAQMLTHMQNATNELDRRAQQLENAQSAMQKNASLARSTASDASDLQTMLSEANARHEEAAANVEELKSLCRQVEGAREETEEQLKQCMVALTETQEALATAEENYELAEQGMRDTRGEAQQAKQQAEGLRSDCADYERKLNRLQQQNDSLTTLNRNGQQGHEELRALFKDSQQQLELFAFQINEKDTIIAELVEKLDSMAQHVRQLEGTQTLKASEVTALQMDLRNMVKENQFVNQQVSKLSTINEKRAGEIENLLSKLTYREELSLALEREKNDLLTTYQHACDEIERFKRAAVEVESERVEFRQKVRQYEQELARLNIRAQTMQNTQNTSSVDMEAVMRDNDEMGRLVRRLTAAATDNKSTVGNLQQSLQAARNANLKLQSQLQTFQMKVVELEDRETNLSSISVSQQRSDAEAQESLRLQQEKIGDLERLIHEMRLAKLNDASAGDADVVKLKEELKGQSYSVLDLRTRNESLTRQLTQAAHLRESQQTEIDGLLRQLASAAAQESKSSTKGDVTSQASIDMYNTLTDKISSLQDQVQEQFTVITQLEEERTRLSSLLYRYESEIVKLEQNQRDQSDV